jgi:hypothetical protein
VHTDPNTVVGGQIHGRAHGAGIARMEAARDVADVMMPINSASTP